MLAVDTETTGIDIFHRAVPFFVTTSDEDGNQQWWEWDVDPLTREVKMPLQDRGEICELVRLGAGGLVLQNGKFDAAAMQQAGIVKGWPWEKTHDTLVAGHLLASNRPHNLTDMVMDALGMDIQPLEDVLKRACNEARRMARSKFPNWQLAKEGLEGMPSAKSGSKKDKKGIESESPWKFDSWLPRTLAAALGYHQPEDGCKHDWNGWTCRQCNGHRWWIVLRDYGNGDSYATIKLWQWQEAELRRLDLWELYLEKMKSLPGLLEMETRGTTIHLGRMRELKDEYVQEIAEAEQTCVSIAAGYKTGSTNNLFDLVAHGYDLELPKSGVNKSLQTFMAEVAQFPVLKRTPTGNQSFDKEALDLYLATLDPADKRRSFVANLKGSRKRAKSVEFLNSYEKYCVPLNGKATGYAVLHPSVGVVNTVTTRLSMSHPNLQQVSKQETKCQACQGEGCDDCGGTGEDLHSVRIIFGPTPGRETWTMDAENIELRIPAYESGEEDLIALFERPKDPPFYGSQHLLNMSIVYEDLWERELRAVGLEKVGPHCKEKYASEEYQWTKNGDFGMQYQCSDETADRTFRRKGAARKLRQKFARLDGLNQKYVAFANKHGYVETIPDKTVNPRRGYPLLCERGDYGKVVSTTPLNYHVQGTAGWWMLKAMNRCRAQLLEWKRDSGGKFDAYIDLTVHDELKFDFPAGTGPEPWKANLPKARKLQRLMEQGGDDIGIPTPVSVKYHAASWAKGKKL